jgi:hypothetical protein
MNLLTTVYRNGIVNQTQIVGDVDDPENRTLIQLIWNGKIQATDIGLNSKPSDHSGTIEDYRAIYLNGIMIVKSGKVFPRAKSWWQFWRQC